MRGISLALVALAAAWALAGRAGGVETSPQLSGRDIYARVLENRFDSYLQRARLTSGDRAGNAQATEFEMWFQSFRGPDDRPLDDVVLSKSLLLYTAPFDIRHSGYLVINNLDRVNDQFVYRSSNRLVRRVNLRGETIFGSDFSVEDILPRELEDAHYQRMPDIRYHARDCFVIRATPRPETRSQYSHFEITIDIARSIPLLTRYWDARGIEVKQLVSPLEHVKRIKHAWVPMTSTMTHLRLDSYTRLQVLEIQPDIRLSPTHFDPRRLAASH